MAQAVEPPQAVQTGRILKPSFNVVSLAELPGSSCLLSADSCGVISCWDITPTESKDQQAPIHLLNAHDDGIAQVLLLKSSHVAERFEEQRWETWATRRAEEDKTQSREDTSESATTVDTAGRRQISNSNAGTEEGDNPTGIPRGEKSEALHDVEDDDGFPTKKGCCKTLLDCCFPCCIKSKRSLQPHWFVATAGEDGIVRIWRWKLLGRSQADRKHQWQVDRVAQWVCSERLPIQHCLELHDGYLAVSLKDNNDIRLVDPITASVRWMLYGHTKPPTAFAECLDGRLISGGADGAVRLWAKRSWNMPNGDRTGGEKTGLQRIADADFDDGLHPPQTPSMVWGQPGQEQESTVGVCSMAFFAHTQQSQRGEVAGMCLRVLVLSGESLPKADTLGLSDPYVVCTLLDGTDESQIKSDIRGRTQAKRTPKWDHKMTLALKRAVIGGKAQLPECSYIDFDVMVTSSFGLLSKPDQCVARCSVNVEELLSQIAQNPKAAAQPSARKLFSPPGRGPHVDMETANLFVGFSQTRGGDSIDVIIDSVDAIEIGFSQKLYVAASMRQSSHGKVKRLPAKVRDVTSIKYNTVDPIWNEVLEFEVPVFIGDRHVSHSSEYRLHFQVYDHDYFASDDFLAELTVPLSEAIAADGKSSALYSLTLAKGYKSHVKKKPFFGGSSKAPVEGWEKGRNVRPSTPQNSSQLGGANPSLRLAFQAIVPCPKQLKCTVVSAAGLTSAGAKEAMEVRMRFVEGNPVMPCVTSVKTSYRRQTLKPVWKEKAVLDVPKELRETVHGFERPPAVRKGWIHEKGEDSDTTVVCVDIYDRDPLSGVDNYLCRGCVPLATAWQAVLDGDSRPKAVGLSHSPEGKLMLGFERGPNPAEQMTVLVDRAENLPGHDATGFSDPFCVVRLADLSQLGEPTDKAQMGCMPMLVTVPSLPGTGRGEAEFKHQEVLELPGAFEDQLVAARPGWHILFDLVQIKSQTVMGSGSVSVLNILNSIASTAPDKITNTKASVRERLENMASPFTAPVTKDPFEDDNRCKPITMKVVLDQLDKPMRQAVDARESDYVNPKQRSMNVSESLGSALVALGLRESTERRELGTEGVELAVRFEIVSRWKGEARGTRSPLSVPMHGPSPVTCLATLANSVVSGHEDGNVFVWDSWGTSSAPLHQFQAHRVPVSAIAVLTPLGCVVTAGRVRNREEAVSDSLLRLWSCVTLELRQTLSLHGAVARCLSPLAIGSAIDDIMQAVADAGDSDQKREKALRSVPPCLAIASDSRQAKQLALMKVDLPDAD
eukprot:TRINITY_DN13053_c0_g2_i1.p1 TRINITY_DN13053_c0_g2~~TRINITY_DN13053_c0_g2_i1.p1  ORF type:complete len:1284 (+),score=172.17 TRINITY_DN13053_c0_g2_i1:89-3940(+)